jgi:Hsp20/alpha crystallin family
MRRTLARDDTALGEAVSALATLTTWDPFKQMERFEEEMGKLFTPPGHADGHLDAGGRRGTDSGGDRPDVDLPGMSPDDVQTELHDRTLTISGSREERHEEEYEGYHARERVFGRFGRFVRFGRSFTLPYSVEPDEVRAEFAKGELRVHVPRPVEAQPQRIEIAAKD